MNIKSVIAALFAVALCLVANAKIYEVKSPDSQVCAKIEDGNVLKFSLYLNSTPLIENCVVNMDTSKGVLGQNAQVKRFSKKAINSTINSPLFIKSEIKDICTQAELNFGNYSLIVRVYDDAFAYRFCTNFGKGQMIVNSETMQLPFPPQAQSWAQPTGGERAYFEDEIRTQPVEKLGNMYASGLPFLVQVEGAKIAILESDVFSYPSLRVAFDKEKKLVVNKQSRYPKTYKSGRVKQAETCENFIAKTNATRHFPWRILQIAKSDKEFFASDIVYKLATASKIKDISWIPYGLCAWDWMARGKLRDVDFDPSMNQQTVDYFVDFAAKFGLRFSLVDEGWVSGDISNDDTLLLKGSRRIDLKETAKRAKEKNVDFLVWALARNMEYKTDEAFKMLADNGVKGVKIDFFERDDQLENELYENLAKVAAKYKLAVFYHGCSRPTGLSRTYPNLLSYESVRGNENHVGMSCLQNVNIALTRNVCGALDYTPGIMTHTQGENPKRLRDILIMKGTRSSQMALFVLFYSPIQMLCDSPTTYEREPEVTKFLASIPTVWDETKALDSKLDSHASVARRSKDTWFYAGIRVNGNHNFKQNLSEFLNPNKSYKVEMYTDTKNSHKIGMDFKHTVKEVSGADTLEFPVANDGGFVMKFTPIK